MPSDDQTEILPMPSPAVADADYRRLLVERNICNEALPAVIVELYGNLRIKSGCSQIPLHASTIREAIALLYRVLPRAERLLHRPEEITEHFRFSINGHEVTTDLDHRLRDGDRLILFSASVGG